jgi:hypothetical protein
MISKIIWNGMDLMRLAIAGGILLICLLINIAYSVSEWWDKRKARRKDRNDNH